MIMNAIKRIINEEVNYSIEGVYFDHSLTTVKTIIDGHRTWRLSKHVTVEGITFHSFGITDPINPPGHGGEWSSNTDAINMMFDTNLVECCVDSWACAIEEEELSILIQTLSYTKDNNMMCDIANDYSQACQEMDPEDFQSWEQFSLSHCLGIARREFANKVIWM
jgi:hypothetical protein